MTADVNQLQMMANKLRRQVIEMTSTAGSGHATSSMSCAEIMAALYFHQMRWDPQDAAARNVDTLVLSKGHATPILWAALHEAGAIREPLASLRKLDSSLEGHPTPSNPWVRVATGSLGQGLAAANGMALANRLDGIEATIYCLMGDGECSEGSVWEAAQFAALQRLHHLVAIVDVNGLGQSGPTPYGHDSGVLRRRFEAFGWNALEIDGHDMKAVLGALDTMQTDGPTAILARTVKGKGVSFLEGGATWHGKALGGADRDRALAELPDEPVSLPVVPRRVGEYSASGTPSWTAPDVSYKQGEQIATRQAFGHALRELGERLPELVVLDGDVMNSTYTEYFAEAFPERFFQSYIAEQNMAGTALGLAVSGKIPVAATFACFLSRAFDFIRMAGHSRPPHLIYCGSHAGVSIGEDGPSQMGLEDLAMLRATIGSTVLYPCDAVSAARLTAEAVRTEGLVYLRTSRGKAPVLYDAAETFPVGGSKILRGSADDAVTVVAAGVTVHEALAAYDHLLEHGIKLRVIDLYSVKPLDEETLFRAAAETAGIVVVEDHWAQGGIGEAVAMALGERCPIAHLAVREEPHSGTPQQLLERHGISRQAIAGEAAALARR